MAPPVSQWFLTYPQCPLPKETLMAHLKTLSGSEIVVCRELHEDGSPHLHAYVKLSEPVLRSVAPTFFDVETYHGNYQPCRSWRAVNDYVKKDGDFIEYGISTESAKSHKSKRYSALLDEDLETLCRTGELNPIHVPNLKRARLLLAQERLEPTTTEEPRGYWYYGEPGTGKSHKARMENPDAYIKAQNKWWDGYNGQDVVILDDFDSSALGHYLKIWTDKWPCTGEIKGGQVPLTYTKFIITSNYTPQTLWPQDEEMCKAISRRCQKLHFNKQL